MGEQADGRGGSGRGEGGGYSDSNPEAGRDCRCISYCEDSPAAPQDEPACACNANVNASKLHVSMGVELAGLLLGLFGSICSHSVRQSFTVWSCPFTLL